MKVIVKENCGNAPRKGILRDFTIAVIQRNESFVSDYLADYVMYEEAGSMSLQGKEALLFHWKKEDIGEIRELELLHIITHGKTAAVNGIIRTVEQEAIHFSTVYVFTGGAKHAKIKEITNYLIKGIEAGINN